MGVGDRLLDSLLLSLNPICTMHPPLVGIPGRRPPALPWHASALLCLKRQGMGGSF